MPSRSGKKKKSPSSVEALDARLAQAGVVRKRRLNTSPRVRAPQSERFSPDELRLPPPIPVRAALFAYSHREVQQVLVNLLACVRVRLRPFIVFQNAIFGGRRASGLCITDGCFYESKPALVQKRL